MEPISSSFDEAHTRNGCRELVTETHGNPYTGREQTQAKHYILKRYLQALAFKVLTFNDITYVDGFSGPWKTETEDFSDSSFMIAIRTLLDVQEQLRQRTGTRRNVRCYFSEENPKTFKKLKTAVEQFHAPERGFEIKTYSGRFEDAIEDIEATIGASFPLIFIDPTGWTGYPFVKIKKLFARNRCEVLITFMFDFIYRFTHSDDEDIIASLNDIFGGPGWRDRLDCTLPHDKAVEKLFRETLKTIGNFKFVVSTKIYRPTIDRPHFFITYATKHLEGLKVFRQTEYDALRQHERNRANAREREREARTGIVDMFAGHQASVEEASVDEIIEEQCALASAQLVDIISNEGSLRFDGVLAHLLENYKLRETNIKDLCVMLARQGRIENTWGRGNHKPRNDSTIRLSAEHNKDSCLV